MIYVCHNRVRIIRGGAALCTAAERWGAVPRVVEGRRKSAATGTIATLKSVPAPAKSRDE